MPCGGGKVLFAQRLSINCKSTGFLLLFLACFANAGAQTTTSFFYPSLVTVNNLSPNQEFQWQQLLAMPTSKSVQLVQLNNLFPLLDNDLLPVILPNTTKAYTFSTSYIRTYPNGDYTWFGELTSTEYCEDESTVNECFDGSFMAMKKDSQTFAELWLDTSYYQIRDLGEGVSAFVELDNTQMVDGCATPSGTSYSGGEQSSEERDGPPLCPVRILVLHTLAARTANPGIVALANAGIASTNIALSRSAVTSNQLSVILAGVQALTNSEWAESGDIDIDRFSLPTNLAIAGYRAQYNADLVFVLTDSVYSNAAGAVTAFGDAVTSGDSAFAIVEVAEITAPRYTFAHEFGHLFGARHEGTDLCASDGDDSGLQDAHGYRFHKGCNCIFTERKDYYTIMSTNCRNGSAVRIQNYSNPDVEYKNKNTGRKDQNNNAQVLRDATCRISNYVVSNEVFAQIAGEDHGCPSTAVTVQANISGDEPIGAYTLKWESSYDWNTWFDVLEVSGIYYLGYTVITPDIAGDKIIIRLTVTTPSGHKIYAWHEVRSKNSGDCPLQRPTRDRLNLLDQNGGIAIFPNPTRGDITLVVDDVKGKYVGFSILNLLGQTMHSQPSVFSEYERLQAVISIPNLPEGGYWLRLQSGGKIKHQKIVIVK